MRRLLRLLGALLLLIAASTPHAAPAQASSWLYGTYTNAYGSRGYNLYVPTSYSGSPMPLVVMIHGCLQYPDDFAAGTRMNQLAETNGFLVLYPDQAIAANSSECWNWYYTINQGRSGEASIIAGMVSTVKANYTVNSAKVYAAGLSAGAAMATIMGCAYPEVFTAVGSHSGLAYGAATTATGGINAMNYGSIYSPTSLGDSCYSAMGANKRVVPVMVIHGTADTTDNPVNATQTVTQWTQANDRASDGVENNNIDDIADVTTTGTTCRAWTKYQYKNSTNGQVVVEYLKVTGLGHAWSGGSTGGSYTDTCGPNASQLLWDFFKVRSK